MKLSVIIPFYNECESIAIFNSSLLEKLDDLKINYEVIYCDDGSTDTSNKIVAELVKNNQKIKLLSFSRNFGKEYALTAGLISASGDAAIMLDSDGQHPVSLIKKFLSEWEKGSMVVIGIRKNEAGRGLIKGFISKMFYSLFNRISTQKIIPGSTDFRLVDRLVIEEFKKMPEHERITRGLIDWLGFKRTFIYFEAPERIAGVATYKSSKLIKLAANSIVSLTPAPLFFFGIAGTIITLFSALTGTIVFVEQIILSDPLGWNFTGTALLSIFLVFLVGVILMSQGILSLYVSQVHSESKQRPIFIIDKSRSMGIDEK